MAAACRKAALNCCSTGVSCVAVRWIRSPTVPSLRCAPSRSRRTSHVRSNGNNCCCVKYTATAPISGPYWMGAVTPGGEGGLRELLTTWTQLVFDAVFLHDQPWRGHVHHL